MIKFLLIIFFVFYIFIKIGGFIMKTLFSGFTNQQNFQKNQQPQQRKHKEGNINIDYMPNEKKSSPTKKNFPGGDYVDYEEV